MPPARRSRTSSGPAAKGAQKTLSFGNKVTKPTTAVPYGKDISSPKAHLLKNSIKQEAEAEPEPKKELVAEEVKAELDTGHVDSSAAVSQQAKAEIVAQAQGDGKSEDVIKAEKVTDAQVKKYWREREGERRTKRVHQEELGVEEKILRLFDMSSQYGPAIGIARMKRWTRAQKLGLAPPIEVLAVLLKEEKKGNDKIERAYVDELMSSKFVVGDAA
ncbi:hypothetical protein ONS96_002195 [Cadophora gregata f. sp. sojae]|nr:hypothetical protein ONS96_002195 [Cadophora gregata f. sp. sojae]